MIRYLQVAGDPAAEIPTTFRTAPHLLSASTIGSENNSDQYHCNHCAYGFHRWFLPGSFLPDWLSGEPLPGVATPGPARPKKLLTRPVSRLHRQQTAPFPKPAKTRW